MRLVVILALCVWSCQGVRGRNCSYPKLPDSFVVPYLESYKDNSIAYYGCKEGKKNVLESWWGEIKCVDGAWSPLPQCIDQSMCITPHVPNAEPQANLEKFYYTGSQVKFNCKEAYRFQSSNHSALCENGRWDLPVCERHQGACDPPARVNNAVIKQKYKELYEEDETLEFACKPGYKMKGPKISICWQKQWGRLPECVLKEDEPQNPSVSACGELPQVPHGTVSTQADSMALVVQCPLFYKLVGPNKVYCEKGKWTAPPVCKPPCVLDEQRFYFYYPNDKYLEEGIRKDYWCKTNYEWTRVSCVDGTARSTCRNP